MPSSRSPLPLASQCRAAPRACSHRHALGRAAPSAFAPFRPPAGAVAAGAPRHRAAPIAAASRLPGARARNHCPAPAKAVGIDTWGPPLLDNSTTDTPTASEKYLPLSPDWIGIEKRRPLDAAARSAASPELPPPDCLILLDGLPPLRRVVVVVPTHRCPVPYSPHREHAPLLSLPCLPHARAHALVPLRPPPAALAVAIPCSHTPPCTPTRFAPYLAARHAPAATIRRPPPGLPSRLPASPVRARQARASPARAWLLPTARLPPAAALLRSAAASAVAAATNCAPARLCVAHPSRPCHRAAPHCPSPRSAGLRPARALIATALGRAARSAFAPFRPPAGAVAVGAPRRWAAPIAAASR
nr:protein transport protein sec31-like [Aegilops tauschii subsp. strangulata]